MNKLFFTLAGCLPLSGCVATVSPPEGVQVSYVLPRAQMVYHHPRRVHYVKAVVVPKRPRPAPHRHGGPVIMYPSRPMHFR